MTTRKATGKYANAWVCEDSDDLSESAAEKVIKNFDETIYSKDTKLFGEARFAENGHKVNILFHEMPQGHLGYFHMLDLFSKRDGVSSKEVKEYGVNLDHAIIHVNSEIASRDAYREVLNSTIAHEFQHLICFSSAAENGFKSMPATWLNESMSGYIEESIYPGIQKKNGRYDNLSQSDLIRHGQSLYNFKTKTSFSPFDIGVYGSVFLFSEYLANKAGKDVFKTIHDSYRDADGSLLEATAIKNAVSSSVKKQIEHSISYPKGFVKMSKDEVWLSKLTLDFYLSMLNYGSKDPKVFTCSSSRTSIVNGLSSLPSLFLDLLCSKVSSGVEFNKTGIST